VFYAEQPITTYVSDDENEQGLEHPAVMIEK
jgi:hypothetical protein